MSPTDLQTIINLHALWLANDPTGKRADLRGAYLQGADLRGAYLRGADLQGANLQRAYLQGADLQRAYLQGADLQGADLQRAYLQGADLRGADLRGAYLQGANLQRAYLQGADLRGAYLRGADLQRANLQRAYLQGADLRGADLQGADLRGAYLRGAENAGIAIARTRILPAGSLIGWKKCAADVIVKLRIPEDAKRSHAFGRKCRAEYVEVLEVIGADVGISKYDDKTEYRVGATVRPDVWSDAWQEECAGGIHFFITREEAEAY